MEDWLEDPENHPFHRRSIAVGGRPDLLFAEVTCRPEDLPAVRDALTAAGITFTEAEISRIPKTTVAVTGEKEASQIIRLMDMLEDLDDVQHAYANFDIPDELMQEVAA